MWPVRQVHVSLPEHLHASEDTDFLVIRCSLCRWSAWFSARGAGLEEIERTVEEHRVCPAGAVTGQGTGNAGSLVTRMGLGRRPE
jgi:hypothetical protein